MLASAIVLALLCAVLLQLGIDVDPALQPAWDLLTALRDTRGNPAGAEYAQIAERGEIILSFGPTREPTVAYYDRRWKRIVVGNRHRDEDPRVRATILAHELTHVRQEQEGLLKRQDCLLAETEAHTAEVQAWRLLWRDQELPRRTPLEEHFTELAEIQRARGIAGLYSYVESRPTYGRYCRMG